MSSSHNLASSQESALATLHQFLEARGIGKPSEGFEAFERELHALCAAVEREALEEELAKLDINVPLIKVDGMRHRQVLRCEETYFGAAGPIRVLRSLYSTREHGERTVCPMEVRAGMIEGRWTPLAAKQASWVVAHLTPQEGEELFKQLGNMTPSKSTLDRLPKQLSGRWEADRVRLEEVIRGEETVPEQATIVAVSLDGVMVPMKDGGRKEKRARAAAEGKQKKGPAGYREAGCATLVLYDDERKRVSTIRLGRMPEKKKLTLKAELRAELDAILAERPDLKIVKLADGAKDNWTYLSKELPDGVEIVDFYHAAEHLSAALIAAYGETSTRYRAQFKKLRHILLEDHRGVGKIIRSLRHLRDRFPRRSKIAQELGYFCRNQKRMKYAEMTERGYPIGSGVVEAACKTLVTQRLKRSGMRWANEGGQAILTLRALAQSRRFDCAWEHLSRTYRRTVTLPENVVAMSAWRAH